MASRLNLHQELCELLGSDNVYFEPPESVKMKYPCIRYSLSGIDGNHADNKLYKSTNRYEVLVIDPNPESKIPYDILNHFEMCRFDRRYIASNLTHFAITLYY